MANFEEVFWNDIERLLMMPMIMLERSEDLGTHSQLQQGKPCRTRSYGHRATGEPCLASSSLGGPKILALDLSQKHGRTGGTIEIPAGAAPGCRHLLMTVDVETFFGNTISLTGAHTGRLKATQSYFNELREESGRFPSLSTRIAVSGRTTSTTDSFPESR